MINISNLKDAISMANRLNPKFRQLAMEAIDDGESSDVKIDTGSPLCAITLQYKDGIAYCRMQLASTSDVKTFLGKTESSVMSSIGDSYSSSGFEIIVSKESQNLLAAAGWLIGCSIKLREQVDKLSDILSAIGDGRRKLLIVICPKEGEAIELLMATDKLPENNKERQHIIGRHRYSMSGEGFRAESKLLYLLTGNPLVKVYAGTELIYCDNPDIHVTDDVELSLEKDITIAPLPATVVVERRKLYEGEFKYELFLESEEEFDFSKLKFYENSSSEFDPDCYDGFSLDKIKYGESILPLINRRNYGTWQARYFFGTLYPHYIDYI